MVDEETLLLAEEAKRLVYDMRKRFGHDADVADFLKAFRQIVNLEKA